MLHLIRYIPSITALLYLCLLLIGGANIFRSCPATGARHRSEAGVWLYHSSHNLENGSRKSIIDSGLTCILSSIVSVATPCIIPVMASCSYLRISHSYSLTIQCHYSPKNICEVDNSLIPTIGLLVTSIQSTIFRDIVWVYFSL